MGDSTQAHNAHDKECVQLWAELGMVRSLISWGEVGKISWSGSVVMVEGRAIGPFADQHMQYPTRYYDTH